MSVSIIRDPRDLLLNNQNTFSFVLTHPYLKKAVNTKVQLSAPVHRVRPGVCLFMRIKKHNYFSPANPDAHRACCFF